VTDAGGRPARATMTLGELALGAGLVAAFVYRELHVANPLIDVRVFRYRAFSAASGASA
jgi:hypothetical protein